VVQTDTHRKICMRKAHTLDEETRRVHDAPGALRCVGRLNLTHTHEQMQGLPRYPRDEVGMSRQRLVHCLARVGVPDVYLTSETSALTH
jgi:ABC-type microcin C transport system duplicated ATPase subunit YejF